MSENKIPRGIHDIQDVDIDEIFYDPNLTARQWKAPRKGTYAAEEFEGLQASMNEHGLLQPIGLAVADGCRGLRAYVIIGVRRYFAAKALGWQTIPAGLLG